MAGAALIAGVFWPTSVEGQFSKPLYYGSVLCFLPVGVALWRFRPGAPDRRSLIAVLVMASILVGATLFSPVDQFTPGVVASFLAVFLLYLGWLPLIRSRILDVALAVVNAVVIVVGLLLMAKDKTTADFIVERYSAFRPDLVPFMLAEGKPVITFCSHAIASFYVFVLFHLTYIAFRSLRSPLWLVLCAGNLLLLAYMQSITGYVYFAIGIAQLCLAFGRQRITRWWVAAVLLLGLAYVFVSHEVVQQFFTQALLAADSPTNGFRGRFGEYGGMRPGLALVAEHPFRPIGFTTAPNINFGDSGLAEYLMRGSAPLLVLMYVGLYLFLRRTCLLRSDARVLFLLFFSFELAYTGLLYHRALFIYVFAVIFVNRTRLGESPKTAAQRGDSSTPSRIRAVA